MDYRKISIGLGFVVAFLVGCVVREVVVPPVRAGTNPTRWEYECTTGREITERQTDLFNVYGSRGWELVGAGNWNHIVWCFKRPAP